PAAATFSPQAGRRGKGRYFPPAITLLSGGMGATPPSPGLRGEGAGRRMRGGSCFLLAEVPLAAFPRKIHLLLPLAEAQAIVLAARGVAMRAGDAGLVERRGDLLGGQRVAAGTAELVLAFF